MTKEKRKLEITLPSDIDAKTLEALLTNEGLKILITTENGQATQTIDATKAKITTEKSFVKVPQGKAINELLSMDAGQRRKKNMKVKIARFESNGLTLELKNFQEIAGLRKSTKQLLQALMAKWTEGDKKMLGVTLSLKEYMELRKLKDMKEARKQINEDLNTLYNVSLKLGEPSKAQKNKKNPDDIDAYNFETRIISGKGEIKNSLIGVVFVPDFAKLMGKNFMQLPTLAFALNGKHQPNAYYFLNKFCELKNMNFGKKGEDVITVSKLMEASPDMKTYEEVITKYRAVKRWIYEPLEKGMDALQDFIEWEYRDEEGKLLSKEEAKALQFHDYADLQIHIHWKQEPEDGWKCEKMLTSS